MKRLFAVILIVFLLCSVVGCKKDPKYVMSDYYVDEVIDGDDIDESNEVDSDKNSDNKSGENPEKKPGKKPGKSNSVEMDKRTAQEKIFDSIKGSVIVNIGNPEEFQPFNKELVKAFCDRYDVRMDWIPMGYNEYVQKLPQMVAAGNPPDTCVMTDATSLSFIYGGLAQPLNNMIVPEDEYWDKDLLNSFKINGNYYAVNTGDINTFFIYYNKTLFDELSIEDPYTLYKQGKWTYAKLREIAKKATIYDKNDKTAVECYGIGTHDKSIFVLANGGNFIEYDNNKNTYVSTVKSAATIAGLNFLRDLCADGSYNASVAGFTEFPSRKIAMFVERPMNAIGNYDLYKKMKDEIGVVPFPQGPNAKELYAPSNFTANFGPTNAANPKGGLAWGYFWLRYTQDAEKQKNSLYMEHLNKMMSPEHKKIIYDFLGKAKKVSCKVDSLTDFKNYDNEFWAHLVWNHKSAEEVSAAMDSIIKSSINKTVKR